MVHWCVYVCKYVCMYVCVMRACQYPSSRHMGYVCMNIGRIYVHMLVLYTKAVLVYTNTSCPEHMHVFVYFTLKVHVHFNLCTMSVSYTKAVLVYTNTSML
jgi:hypothetical protein